jgi:hypothetical protein
MSNELITSARARANINQSTFTDAESRLIDELAKAVSSAVKKYCGRDFVATDYDELYSGTGTRYLYLRNYPTLSVSRVATGLTTVLRITNTSASNQRATVAVTSTGLELVRVASGTETSDTSLTFDSYATLGSLAAAVTALGNGWGATVPDSAFSTWASSDLRALQGALNARNVVAELRFHAEDLAGYEVDADRGWLVYGGGAPTVWGDYRGVWAPGLHNYRVVYSAGYAVVPEDVQAACAAWVAVLFYQAKRDPGLRQEAEPGKVSRTVFWSESGPPLNVRNLLKARRALPNFARDFGC